MRALFTLTVFLGASLLFFIQPMVAKHLLPFLGGTPAVWTTCMLFFQAVLLLGYTWAHLVTRLRTRRAQTLTHGMVLLGSLLSLPLSFPGAAPALTAASPVWWILSVLVLSVGAPFLVLSTNAPLLQRWFAATGDRADPYFLYAASNAGSLLALLAYPFLIEPSLTLAGQRTACSAGVALFVFLTLMCGGLLLLRAQRHGSTSTAGATDASVAPPRLRNRMAWVLLAFVPSSLMIGATQHITTDIAPVPLLWVVPLALYLLTFILAFSCPTATMIKVGSWALMALAFAALGSLWFWHAVPGTIGITLHLLLLLSAALVLHGRLSASRPHSRHLTGYFLCVAVGGALGGLFNAIVAPHLFNSLFEYPLAIALAFLLRDRSILGWPTLLRTKCANLVFDALAVLLMIGTLPSVSAGFSAGPKVVHTDRTFFGVHRVTIHDATGITAYHQGTTIHGMQRASEPGRALSYYHDFTGIGELFAKFGESAQFERVGLVGLGVGSLAAQARPAQRLTFYEIDPAVVWIARDSGFFGFLQESRVARVDIVIGDGRRLLAREPASSFDLLVLDAFSSDAVPVHFLTREAFALYSGKLRSGGLLAFHVTNRYLRLTELVATVAHESGLVALEWAPSRGSLPPLREGEFEAAWVVAGRDGEALQALRDDRDWRAVPIRAEAQGWTDDFSNLVQWLK
ncbi:MAG: fused MFS/spermidine synthase [Planctomycetota bacterium]